MQGKRPNSLTDYDSRLAQSSRRLLSDYARTNESLIVHVGDAPQETTIELPAAAVTSLMDILDKLAAGQEVMVVSKDAELTTVQAADVLHVSRPFLIKLLEAGEIPFHKVGTHRRVRMVDVLDYKRTIDEAREAVLDQLVTDAQIHHMGYE
jgi:excisionase family DNA binding protein